jgi:hypothetical protein
LNPTDSNLNSDFFKNEIEPKKVTTPLVLPKQTKIFENAFSAKKRVYTQKKEDKT